MVFSSISFIFYFLPLVLGIYYLMAKRYRNAVLFLASLVFYFIGEGPLTIIFIISIIWHYLVGRLIEKYHKKSILIIGILFDIALLGYFKYANFVVDNLNLLGLNIKLAKIILPIGISFFTFQGMSYLADVYSKSVKAADSLVDFGAYLALFPQLIAGPIVRYEDVANDLKNRQENSDDFVAGIRRFIIGLSKKTILADSLGFAAKTFAELSSRTILSSWLEALAITLQLYFDFSAYSDMAIGIGLLFGFHFLENFNYPLFATSITDFWRRWHISLGTWFKDYIYIPLGGSRVKPFRRVINIMAVWFLTGLWHGANWTFIFWGVYFGVILLLEKYFYLDKLKKHPFIGWVYTFIIVLMGFVIFNSDSLALAFDFIAGMWGIKGLALWDSQCLYYLKNFLVLLLVSFILAAPWLKDFFKQKIKASTFKDIIVYCSLAILFLLSLSYLVANSFSPFLYFRF